MDCELNVQHLLPPRTPHQVFEDKTVELAGPVFKEHSGDTRSVVESKISILFHNSDGVVDIQGVDIGDGRTLEAATRESKIPWVSRVLLDID